VRIRSVTLDLPRDLLCIQLGEVMLMLMWIGQSLLRKTNGIGIGSLTVLMLAVNGPPFKGIGTRVGEMEMLRVWIVLME